MDYGALGMCSSLKVLQLPERLEKVDSALLFGAGIETLVIPSHVSRIEWAALGGCKNLRKVQMPATVSYLGDGVFTEGTPLDTLILGCEVPPTLGSDVFEHYNTTLYVPVGTSEAYRQHAVWGKFTKIVEL